MTRRCKWIPAILLSCVIVVFAAMPASAMNVEFHGKALTGLLASSNSYLLGGKDADSATIGVGKFRLRAEAATDDGRARMVYGFETGANNFGDSDSWKYSGDSTDFENRFAYIQLVIPGTNDRITGRAGLQKTGVNEWLWTETAAGLTLHGKGGVNWSAGWFRGLEEDFGEKDSVDTDLYMIMADIQPAPALTLGAFGVYAMDFGGKKNIHRDADQYWIGLAGKINGPIFASGDLIYQGGEAGPGGTLDVAAYLANATVGVQITDNSRVAFNALYVSGDDDDTDGDLDAFQSIDADVKVGQIFFKDSLAASLDRFVDDQFGADMPVGLRNNGLVNLAVEGEIRMNAKNSLRAAIRYLATAEDCPVYGEDELGYEIDIWYAHEMNRNLSLKLEGAYLFSGKLAERIFNDSDDVYQVAAGLEFSF